ncbi:MAG: heterodisulfide reductase [Myxococcales bacterium]|nr:MAG: heterodisulfide reductase [Myxococcales bacterium]
MSEQFPETGSRTVTPECGLAERIAKDTGVNAMDCYQCGKCSAGCPLVEATDLLPHDFWRMVQLGLEEPILRSRHLWLCMACETCGARCPNKLPLSKVIDWFRQKAVREGREVAEPDVVAFHEAFLASVRSGGRLSEVKMIGRFKRLTGDYFKDMKLGMMLFRKGKIKLFGGQSGAKRKVRELFEGIE